MRAPWLYRALLRLLPRRFRERYRGPIEAEIGKTPARGAAFWSGAFVDLLVGLLAAWRDEIARRLTGHRRSGAAGSGMDGWTQDLRYALRGLRQAPGVTTLCVVAIALGTGANTAVFTLVNEILLRPLPVSEPSRLVNVHVDQPGTDSFAGFSFPEFLEFRDRSRALAGLAASSGTMLRLGERGATDVVVQLVSGEYFPTLGVPAARGRLFGAREAEDPGESRVAVVSHGFWERVAAADPGLLGREIMLDGSSFTVIGVTPRGFSGRFIGFPVEVWLPLAAMETVQPGRRLHDREERPLELFARLAPGVEAAAAEDILDRVAARLEREYPEFNRGRRVSLEPLTGIDSSLRGGVIGFLGILLTLSGLVLVAACLNVGNLLLARGHARRPEIATRLALGATRGRLVRLLLTETLVLFAVGAAAAGLLAWQLTGMLRRFIETLAVPVAFQMHLDLRVLGLTLALALLTGLLTGSSPAWRATRISQAEALRCARLTGSAGGRLRRAFVIGQVAVSLVLLVAAGLFLRALAEGQRLDPGFPTEGLYTLSMGVPAERYSEQEARLFFDTLRARLAASPAVAAATLSSRPPLGVARTPVAVAVPGVEPPAGADAYFVDAHVVGETYFETVGLQVLAGRGFDASDDAEGRPVAAVNVRLATRFWPREEAIGQILRVGDTEVVIVGVIAGSRHLIHVGDVEPLLYLPHAQSPARRQVLLLRSHETPAEMARIARDAVAGLDGTVEVAAPRRLTDQIASFLLPQRLVSRIAGGLGIVGLILAIAGVYGIVAYSLHRRRRELGLRMALGGTPGEVVRLVLRSGGSLVALGMAVGLALVAILGPLLRGFLFGVSPADPWTVGGVALVLAAAGMTAAYLPARRAATIDPAETLRDEA